MGTSTDGVRARFSAVIGSAEDSRWQDRPDQVAACRQLCAVPPLMDLITTSRNAMTVKPVLIPVGALPDQIKTKKASGADFSSYMDRAAAPASVATPEDELQAYVNKTPAERMRDAILKQLDLTQDELNAMPPEQRKGVEAQITDLMKQALEKPTQKTGNNIDTSA
jgi:hypothetical protein